MKTYHYEAYTIYVGQNAIDNDELTFDLAKPTDLWFHVKDYPGAHVVLRMLDTAFTSEGIRVAANYAKHHSKARSLSKAQVEYCDVLDVCKPSKHSPAGLVTVQNSKMITVKTSIKDTLDKIAG
jgi:predicted ribosome quality control (RQC) complex YloA/Tae2 family protein